MKTILAALALMTAASAIPTNAYAIGCLSGAAVGGVAGHVAGHHAILGAAAGCAIGHHEAVMRKRRSYEQQSAPVNSGYHQ
jgi:outer membrane lipoprotein SlyB